MDTNETKIYSILLIAAGILGIIVAYFIITTIRFQRRNLLLQKQKLQAEIDTLENERKRIASDLHDELGPLLSAVKLHINCVDIQDGEDSELIRKANSHIDSILTRIREIANDLMPQALLRKGVITAIQEFIYNIQLVNPIKIRFLCQEDISIDADIAVHLYRIIMEIIQNTIKHAHANELKIEFRKQNNKLILLIQDDGQGFQYQEMDEDNAGLGLKNILSRVQIIKGDVAIDTTPGKGTRYSIEIPV
jgi:signal transduction histidine kinase